MKKICYILLTLVLIAGCNLGPGTESEHSVPDLPFDNPVTASSRLVIASDETVDTAALENTGLIILDEMSIAGERFIKVEALRDINLMLLKQIPGVTYAEEDMEYSVHLVPDDPLYGEYQYSAQVTGLEAVWDTYTGAGVTVAVVDSGINALHEDFGGSSSFTGGYDAIRGIPLSTSTNSDDNMHGTHVAGIIGARQNSVGISGAAPGVTLMPVKVMDENGSGNSFDIARGITWAADNGADIINLSLGNPMLNYAVNQAVNHALSMGVVVVVSAGNDSNQKINYPAALHGVITVAATNGKNEVTGFSTRGSHLDIAAPGHQILSLAHDETDGYINLSGTSMAAPFVSGVAALILEAKPAASPAQVKEILKSTAADIEAAGFDQKSGYGLVDPAAAVAEALPQISSGSINITTTNNGEIAPKVLVYVRDADETIITAGITDMEGSLTIPGLTPGNYTVDGAYFRNTAETGILTVGEETTASGSMDFSLDLLTINTGPSGYRTNGVDAAMVIVEYDGVNDAYISYSIDDVEGSNYPALTFPVMNGIEYFVGFIILDNSVDSSGYLSLKYTLGPLLDFSGDGTTRRLIPRYYFSEARSSAAMQPDTSYYVDLTNPSSENIDVLFLDFDL